MRVPMDELSLLAALRGAPLPVVKCLTSDIRVPADAEYVIEGVIDAAGYTAGEQIAIGLDCASSEFYKDGKYHLEGEGLVLDAAAWTDMLATWVDKYPIISIEDGMAEGDWEGWKILTDRLGDKVQLVGDDLFVTNTKRLKDGISKGVANSILIKVNQIGTLTETINSINLATRNSYIYYSGIGNNYLYIIFKNHRTKYHISQV